MRMHISENLLLRLAYASIWSIALFSFVSLSASALSHILVIIPAFYYTYKSYSRGKLNLSRSNMALLITIFFSVLSILYAPDIAKKFKQVTKLKYMLIGVLAIYPYIEVVKRMTLKKTRKIINTFLVLLSVGNVAGVYALFSGFHPLRLKEASDGFRAAGMYGMAITYGYGVELILVMLISILILYRKKISCIAKPIIFYIAVVTTTVGFYFAFARGALLGLIVSVPFIFIKTNKKFFRIALFGGFLILSGLTVLVFNIPEGSEANRFLLRAKTTSNMIRLSQYEAAYKGFLEKPLLGWGYRNFEPNAYSIKKKNGIAYADFYGHAHNNYLEFLVSTGFFGFLAFCSFVIFWFFEALERNDEFSTILIPFIVSFSVSGLFQNTINDGENMFVIMFFYTLTYALPSGSKIFDKTTSSRNI